MSFEKIQIEIYLVVKARYLSDPAVGIFKDLSQYLLRYSRILSGFPLSFEIEGVKPTGSGLHCINGYVNGVFPVTVDGNESFTGDLCVTELNEDKLVGTASKIEEESDF